MGEGANVLISDAGIKGLVIILQNKNMQIINGLISIDAGVSMHHAIAFSLKNNWGGLEDFGGIPGSVGGAVCMNIHYFDALLSDFIETVTILDLESLEITEITKNACNFGYNKSLFLEKKLIVLAVTLRLKKLTSEETAYARGRHDEIVRQRSRRYPPTRTCGSFFRNFFPHEYEQAKGKTKVPYIAYYLESVGVKGQLSSGKASVFSLHANMLVTSEGATSHDVVSLATIMQQNVYNQFGLWPVPECQLLGFEKNPFLQKKL
jgi:UDP-N-acetylmuramate dehydrogenase